MKKILIILTLSTSLQAGLLDFIFNHEVSDEARERAVKLGTAYGSAPRIDTHTAHDPDNLIDRGTYKIPSVPDWVYHGKSVKTNKRFNNIVNSDPVKNWDDYMKELKAKHETSN